MSPNKMAKNVYEIGNQYKDSMTNREWPFIF